MLHQFLYYFPKRMALFKIRAKLNFYNKVANGHLF
jgi:hypothetical protein